MADTEYAPLTERQQYEILRTALTSERSSFITHWRELNDWIRPRRGRFTTTDNNRGDRRNQKIIDSAATFALRTLSSGMMSGMTNPARTWFRLQTPDPELNKFARVKRWLDDVRVVLMDSFRRSNLYTSLPLIYADQGLFGTAAMASLEHPTQDLRFKVFEIGSYMLATNADGQVRTFLREYRLTVAQLVESFAAPDAYGRPTRWDNISTHVKRLWETGQRQVWVDVVHVIAENRHANSYRLGPEYKPYRSCYYERGTSTGQGPDSYDPGKDMFLRVEGFDEFPIQAPAWIRGAEDAYGTDCPGMDALGDVKQLQLQEKLKLQGIEKIVKPPMIAPASFRSVKTSTLPGDITYGIETSDQKFRPAQEIQLSIQELSQDEEFVRQRIRRAFYEDLFLMLAYSDPQRGVQPVTAREIEERHEEKLIMLGPVLGNSTQDLLEPIITRAYNIKERRGEIPPPPPELRNLPISVEFIGVLAQAQRAVGIAALDRFAQFSLQMAPVIPSILDKVNTDELADEYADTLMLPAKLINSEEDVAAIRQARAQSAQQQQMAEAMPKLAQGAKTLSETDPSAGALPAVLDAATAGGTQ